LLLNALLISLLLWEAVAGASVVVDLKPDGSAVVTHVVEAPEGAELVEVKLLCEPEALVAYGGGDVVYVEASSNESGWYARAYYPPSSFTLAYSTSKLANYSSGFWTVKLCCPYVVEVKLPEGVVPTLLPKEALELSYLDDRLVVELPPGSHVIEYSVPIEPPPPPSPSGSLGAALGLVGGVLGGLAVGLGIAAWMAVRRRRRAAYVLDDTDKAILDLVKRKGPLGVAEVAELLDIPRSTAHRKLRKLAKYGLVRLERVGPRLVAS